jgi:hypothetical protein
MQPMGPPTSTRFDRKFVLVHNCILIGNLDQLSVRCRVADTDEAHMRHLSFILSFIHPRNITYQRIVIYNITPKAVLSNLDGSGPN